MSAGEAMLGAQASSPACGISSALPSDSFDVINPATGKAFASAPSCGALELEEAAAAAGASLPSWRSSELARRRVLRECARALRHQSEELARLITLEQGKPLREARGEAAYAAAQFEQCAAHPIPRQESWEGGSRTLIVQRPLGVVAIITPWNYPLGTAAVKLAPALLMGNAAILKPSPHAPLSPLLMGRILSRHLPHGVLSTLAGDDALGALLAQHPAVRKISLTGSTETGSAALRYAAADMKRVTLELGGNDPALVLPDADPAAVAGPILQAAWRNAGQVCSAIKRVYVHESLLDKLLRSLREAAKAYRIGDGLQPATRLGPITTLEQLDRLHHYASLVKTAGGTLHCASLPKGLSGYFFAPGFATGLSDEHPLVAEEQFGPLLPILPYRSIQEAIRRANDSPYGLSASVWTSSPSLGYEVAAQLECGRVGINGHRRGDAPAPFGGFKRSGIGRELGIWGMLGMAESQVINVF